MSISTPINGIPLTFELNPISTPFLQYLYERVKAHNEEYQPCLFKHLPMLQDIDEPCTFGVFSQQLMKSKKQYLSARASVNINGALTTVTNVSRLYLDYYHPHRLRAFGALIRDTYEYPQQPPLYVVRSIMQNGSYVDIRSTYFSILLNIGWDISFWKGVWLTPGRAPSDFPLARDKAARSYLVTGALKSAVGVWNGYKTFWMKTHNKHINYELWGCIQCILHSIAQYAVMNCHAVYVHTDGYIIPSEYVADLLYHIRSYGLDATVKATGVTIVCGFANYMCGEKRTKIFRADKATHPYDKIRWDIDAIWVRNTVASVIRKRNLIG